MNAQTLATQQQTTHDLVRLLIVDHTSDRANGVGSDTAERRLGVPVDDLSEPLLLEVRLQGRTLAALLGEHEEDVTQSRLAEVGAKVLNALLRQVGLEEGS